MASPTINDFIISQGDSLPVMQITVPRNSVGELVDLTGCTVVFLGRKTGTNSQPAIVQPIESFEVVNDEVVVFVHFTAAQTRSVLVPPGETYAEMQGELEITDADGEVLTVPTENYIPWFIRDDIGDAPNG